MFIRLETQPCYIALFNFIKINLFNNYVKIKRKGKERKGTLFKCLVVLALER